MKCTWHPDVEAVSICTDCGSVFCEECKVIADGRTYCNHCKAKPRERKAQGSARPIFLILGVLAALVCAGWLFMKFAAPPLMGVWSQGSLATARQNVLTIAKAIERYTASNNGALPQDESQLTNAEPPFLKQSYNEQTIAGYRYYISLHSKGYEILAAPEKCHTTGEKVVMLKRGQPLSVADCD